MIFSTTESWTSKRIQNDIQHGFVAAHGGNEQMTTLSDGAWQLSGRSFIRY